MKFFAAFVIFSFLFIEVKFEFYWSAKTNARNIWFVHEFSFLTLNRLDNKSLEVLD